METVQARADTAALIAVAAAEDRPVTARSLELWRYRGLLPRPQRQTGGRAIWLYPRGTERQLSRLLHWRDRTRSHEQILLALWVEGFPVEFDRVRAALANFVRRWSEMIEEETAGSESGDEAALVDGLARKLARMRGKKAPLPHLARMRLSERERAYAYMVATMFGMEKEVERRAADLPHLERMLGLRSGHNGGLSPTLGLIDPAGQVTQLPTPDEARAAVNAASPQELELVRRVVQIFVIWLPLAIPALLSDQAAKSVHLVDLIRQLFAEPPPDLFALVIAAFLVLLQAKEPTIEELRTHLDALDPDVVRAMIE